MNKDFWGHASWITIHTAGIRYKPETSISFKQFIYALPYLLPCELCREHLYDNLKTIPLDDAVLQNNNTVFLWTYLLHDLVNKQIGKTVSPQFQVIKNYYETYIPDNTFWGPFWWRTIHSFAASYRPIPQVKNAFKQFIYSLIGLIPCTICSDHYKKNLNNIPLSENYLKDAHNLFLWSYLFHDLINKQLGKVSPPFQQIKSQYFNEHVCSNCGITK